MLPPVQVLMEFNVMMLSRVRRGVYGRHAVVLHLHREGIGLGIEVSKIDECIAASRSSWLSNVILSYLSVGDIKQSRSPSSLLYWPSLQSCLLPLIDSRLPFHWAHLAPYRVAPSFRVVAATSPESYSCNAGTITNASVRKAQPPDSKQA